MKKKVVVGLSGGVDSAVAALLLKDQGHEVIGIFMKNWEDEGDDCPAEEDAREARLVADAVGIPFYTFNFVKQYWDNVFSAFLQEYSQGFTPNPDILCNKEIKFKCFLEKALELEVDCIATGHYARVRQVGDHFELLKGVDPDKDQSYFLHALGQRALSKTVFPLGGLMKQEVREIAKTRGLPNWDRKDSTGICFIGERKFTEFLKSYLGAQPGEIQDPSGRVVGRHQGLMYHTIGQRQGLGIGGPGEPWFVVGKDIPNRVLIAAQGKNNPLLFAPALTCSEMTTLSDQPLETPIRCRAKIRYRQADQACRVHALEDGMYRVDFDESQRAISPKQSVVFYDGDVCLGGAVIETAVREPAAVSAVAGS
ncbi:MAG: tRNA 2-thiouridine(34) synthase MnmA [Acidobacteriota bacterium]|nr:tRNA 2-thiouridine(34) synthase MnmA [Acidobacteriota bacterium]